jgi:hypothetical protein
MSSLPIKQNIANTTPVPMGMQDISYPCTLVLDSSAAGRLVELSVNSGALYFTPDYNAKSTATQIMVIVGAPITHARFTGQAGDKITILPGVNTP